MRDVAVFGLDGTIANNRHRLHLLAEGKISDYDSAIEGDTLFPDTAAILYGLRLAGTEVWIITGRRERVRDETIKWLSHQGIIYRKLLMRSDHRSRLDTYVLKRNLFMLHRVNHPVLVAYDADENTARMWAKMGLASCLVLH